MRNGTAATCNSKIGNRHRSGEHVRRIVARSQLPGAREPDPATNSNGGNSNNKLCHIDVAVADRCNTNNLQLGEGNATLRRCSEVNVKRAIAHDYSATIPPLEIIAYSVTARVYAKRNLSRDSVSALLCAY